MTRIFYSVERYLLLFALAAVAGAGSDPGLQIAKEVKDATHDKLRVSFEVRSRLESRNEGEFGRQSNQFADFLRTRVGISYRPLEWLRVSAMGQDARAPFLGRTAPSSMRDPFDVQESYVELFGERKTGFGFDAGRRMVQYGDTRLIGAPQWAFTARTYDMARASWRTSRIKLEGLFLSPIKPNGQSWNKPTLGDRVWGTYNTFSKLWGGATADVYALRHMQNRPGGWTGLGRFRTDSYGGRWASQLTEHTRYTAEGIIQKGRVGTLPHSAYAWVAQVGYKCTLLGRPLDNTLEYKFASGGGSASESNTFDQIYPAAHDKLGHADLLGWRNIRNAKVGMTWSLSKALGLIAMFNDSWLADKRDAAYNLQGKAIARSPLGVAGSHLGREADIFATYKRGTITLGAGAGRFFPGEFIRNTTPGRHQTLLYLFQNYSF